MATNRYDLQVATFLLLLAVDTHAFGIKRALVARQDDHPGGPDGPGDADETSSAPPISPAPAVMSSTTSPISTSTTTIGVTAPSITLSPTIVSSTIEPSPTSTPATIGPSTKSSGNDGLEPPGQSHLANGSKGGIVLGAVLAVLFLGAAIFMLVGLLRRRRRLQYRSRTARDPDNPHLISARNVGPASDRGDSEQSSLANTAASSRPWFDVGAGSTELSAETRETTGAGLTGSWVMRKPELPAPVHTVPPSSRLSNTELTSAKNTTYEMPDARGTRFSPAELPGSVPKEEEHKSVSGGERSMVRNVSLRTDPTWDSSTNTWMTTSPSTDTSMPERGLEELVSPCSPCSPCEGEFPWGEEKL